MKKPSWNIHNKKKTKVLMSTAGDIARDILTSRGLSKNLVVDQMSNAWTTIVGAGISCHSLPASLRGKKLTIITDSPVWSQQLSFLRDDLKQKINTHFKENVVSEIILKIGSIKKTHKDKLPIHIKPLSSKDNEFIKTVTEEITDSELKEILNRILARDLSKRTE